jgi:thiol-disulfide isomerase/thioredoxin
MKKFSALLVLLLCAIFCASCGSNKEKVQNAIFSYSPEKPTAGQEVTVTYKADSTDLSKAKNIDMIAYLYSDDLDNTLETKMTKNANSWTGKFKTEPDTKGIVIRFVDDSSEDTYDNNNKKGYLINLYDKNGDVLPGSYAGYATAIITWGNYYVDLDRNPDSAIAYFNKDFTQNPSIKNTYLKYFVYAENLLDPAKADSISNAALSQLAAQNPTSETYLITLASGYGRIDPAKAQKYVKMLEEKYPQSDYLQQMEYSNINNEMDINKKIEEVKDFGKKFPNSKYLADVYDLPIKYYRDNNKYADAITFIRDNNKNVSPYLFYYMINLTLKKKAHINDLASFAELGVKRAKVELDNPSTPKPNYESEKEWKNDREQTLGMNLYSLAQIQYNMKNKKQAQKNLAEAVDLTEGQVADINELYTKTLIDNGNYDKALDEAGKFIKSGESTSNMKDLLKIAYEKKNKGAKGYADYESQFEKAAQNKLTAELKKQMIDKPAPNFTLQDLNGKEVSLSSLKGKTVVIDFWATWCGPCKASFPAMKEAVEKYSNQNNVKFLFVNTWENVKDKKQNAEEFIKQNKYPFHVLLDKQNEVVAKYQVSGIPTKFVVDKNGNIRFMSVGFEGNTDQMVDEISAMISMVN